MFATTLSHGQNIKLDVVDGHILHTSASGTISGPITIVEGLGVTGLTLITGGGSQSIVGTKGGDTIDGGTGADALIGELGNDIYVVDNAADVVTENANEGTDTVQTSLSSYALGANVENLTGTSGTGQSLAGNALDNTITGGSGNDTIEGLGGSDTLDGGGGDDVIIGSNGSDVITGGIGIDALIGLAGANTLSGGPGDDVYYSSSATDIIIESAGGGNEVVVSNHDITLSANVERVILQGAATAATGNGDDNLLFGLESSHSLTLDGGGGNDIIYGSQQSDTLIGGTGNDALLGFDGTNSMAGGAGDDTYYSYSATDIITENVGEGTDRVISTHDITLSANVENVLLLGLATSATGNGDANDINGSGSGNGLVLDGGGGADVIIGSNQADLITGGTGNDFMFGGGGADAFQFPVFGFGQDTVTDFVQTDVDAAGHDYVDLRGLGETFGSLTITYGTSATISFAGHPTDTIVLIGVTGNLHASDFLF
jgi:Ca2+-binding RTX toxin-like protein